MFGSAHQQAPEQAIEIIKGGDAFESRAGEKARPLMAFGMFEIEPISAETIIAHMAKPGLGGRLVGNFHSVRTKMGDLLRVRSEERRVGKAWFSRGRSRGWPDHKKKKKKKKA